MPTVRNTIKALISCAAVSLASTFITAALTTYGVINVSAARWELFLAGLVIVGALTTSDYLCDKSWKHILTVFALSVVLVGTGLFWLDGWALRTKAEQDAHTTPPPLAKEITRPPVPPKIAYLKTPPKPKSSGPTNIATGNQNVTGNAITGSQVCPGGICAGGDITGSPSVTNNFGQQLLFTEQRMDNLAGLLAARHGSISISVENTDSTTLQDATNLLTAFAKTRTWTTQGVNTSTHGSDIGADGLPIPTRKGIYLSTRSEKSSTAKFIKEAIKQVTGIEAHVETDETLTNLDVGIFVGAPE
jgi:hypothetical protein